MSDATYAAAHADTATVMSENLKYAIANATKNPMQEVSKLPPA